MRKKSAFISGWLNALFIQPEIPKPKAQHHRSTIQHPSIAHDFSIVGQVMTQASHQAIAQQTTHQPHLLKQLLHYESKQP